MRVEVAPIQVVGPGIVMQYHWRYFVCTLRDVGIEPAINADLISPAPGAFEFRVDGSLSAYDFSDFCEIEIPQDRYRIWFKRMICDKYWHDASVGSFPGGSFINWQHYRETLARTSLLRRQRNGILHKQAVPKPTNAIGEDLARRRLKARCILEAEFGEQVDTVVDLQPMFFEKAATCLASVHIPGSWANMLDRGQLQLMGLGVCTISPEILTCCLGDPLVPWKHYVPIDNDFSNLVEQVRWCGDNPRKCSEIEKNAKEFFMTHCTPAAIWSYVLGKL